MFCKVCGIEVPNNTLNCPNCGAAIEQSINPEATQVNATNANDKLMGILSYLGFLVFIPVFAGKTRYARFHANQGLVLLIGVLLINFVGYILHHVLSGWADFIGTLLQSVNSVFAFILSVVGIVHAAQMETKPLPLIGSIRILK